MKRNPERVNEPGDHDQHQGHDEIGKRAAREPDQPRRRASEGHNEAQQVEASGMIQIKGIDARSVVR